MKPDQKPETDNAALAQIAESVQGLHAKFDNLNEFAMKGAAEAGGKAGARAGAIAGGTVATLVSVGLALARAKLGL